MKVRLNLRKRKTKRPEICLSLSCKNLLEVKHEIAEFGQYAQIIEWCADSMEGAYGYTKESFLEDAKEVKKLCGRKTLSIDYKAADGEEVEAAVRKANRVMGWAVEVADMIDIDADNPEIERLIKMAKRKRVKTEISHHEFSRMPDRNEIAEMFIRLEKTGGDILKVACFAEEEADTYSILEGASAYSQLSGAKPIVAIAMGEEGRVSRICAGDFGSVISYACGSVPTAPGQFNARQLSNYMDKYYKEEK